MGGDLLARTDPDPLVLLDIIEETLQGAEAPRPAKQATVHADRHHLRRLFPLFIQHIKTVFEVSIKLLGGGEALRGGKAHCTSVQKGKSSP